MDKENKKLAYLAATFMHTPYCECCPVSEGCELDFIKDDMECWLRFFEWYEGTDHGTSACGEHRRVTPGQEHLTYSEAKMLVKLRDEFMTTVKEFDGVSFRNWHADFLFDQLMRAYKAGKAAAGDGVR